MDLFEHHREQTLAQTAPLAARMRPRTLDEFVGQHHIVGPGRLLRRAIQADQLSSLIFYGPPGTGKTTLARIIANTTKAHFKGINAVLAGVKDIRESIKIAEEKLGMFGQRTILFVDEVHRFNKAQQDALLPHVENGTIILIGATTENPYFEVNKALVSRSRIFQVNPLDESDLKGVAWQALQDEERGYGKRKIQLTDDALTHLVNVANGDARALLNAIELAVETTDPDEYGLTTITVEIAEESIQQRAVLYDKDGDAHFDTISAFIKSIRGSDPDAALYWLSKMLYAGEDPRFIFRRMLILAGEDVGLADPNALVVVSAAAQAFDYVGLPEGRFHLSQACLYLATCPKSNTTLSFFDALDYVQKEREADVPDHLKDGNRDGDDFGHGAGYLYPHAYRDHWVEQQYLPSALQGRVFYQPSNQGYEARIRDQVARRREAQLAAMLEPNADTALTWSESDAQRGPQTHNVWLQRTLGSVGQHLAQTRDRLFKLAALERHNLVLDINAGTGLLTWEAVRRVPAGGVWALVANERNADTLEQQSQQLDSLARPVIFSGQVNELTDLVQQQTQDEIYFDTMIGRNCLGQQNDMRVTLAELAQNLALKGRLVFVETIFKYTQRLYRLLNMDTLDAKLAQAVIEAEEAIYQQEDDPLVCWTVDDLKKALDDSGFNTVQLIQDDQISDLYIGAEQIKRWFTPAPVGQRPSYIQHLQKQLTNNQITQVQTLFERQIQDQMVEWKTALVFIEAEIIVATNGEDNKFVTDKSVHYNRS
ncbi:MAG: AAA family ATPase [Chloroflexota bacterium]